MRKEQNNDNGTIITARTNIKLPLSLIVCGVAGFAAFLYAQQQIAHNDNERKFTEARNYTDSKASDRYTSVEARQLTQSLEQRFNDMAKQNGQAHDSIQRQLDRNARDIALLRGKE